MKINSNTEIRRLNSLRNAPGKSPQYETPRDPPVAAADRSWAITQWRFSLFLALGFWGLVIARATELAIGPVPGRVLDTRPTGTPHVGTNNGAAWVAADFDGTTTRTGAMQFVASNRNQITVQGTADFDSNVGTITFWLRTVGAINANPGAEGAMIFDRRTGAGTVIVLHDNGRLFEQHTAAGVESVARVDDGNWHHVALCYDQSVPGTLSIYVDGTFDVGAENLFTWTWPLTRQIELGTSHDPWWRSFNGFLDDVRLYNRQLTEAEIAQVHSTGALVDPDALVLRFNFDAVPLGVEWDAPSDTLQSANRVTGPFMDMQGTTSPYLFIVPDYAAPGANQFFRTRR